MYCFTYVNSLNCILNELALWADISGEHAVFVDDLAHLTNNNLPQELTKALSDINTIFKALNKRVRNIKKAGIYETCRYIMEIRELVNRFLLYDMYAVGVYQKVMQIIKEERTFKLFLDHTIKEQEFMYQTIYNIKMQIGE